MRIAVLNITGGGMSGGYRRYLSAVLPRLATHPDVSSVLCASAVPCADVLLSVVAPKIKFIPCAPFRFMSHRPDVALGLALDSFKPDVLFIPVERYIKYKNIPVVVMLQNMAPLAGVKTGAGLKEWLLAVARRHETHYALRHASSVIVPTESVHDFLVRRTGIRSEKIFVINYGSSPFLASPAIPTRSLLSPQNFIFTAGSLENYRGVEDIIQALPILKSKFPGIKLVVAGAARAATESYAAKLKELAVSIGVGSDIFWLGNIGEAELSWCYSNCSAFVLASRVESFCFIALEAMAHGCNCVSASSPCLPEVLKNTALYYDVGDIGSIAAALSKVLSRSTAEKNRFRKMALQRAAEFSWDNAVSSTVRVLSGTGSNPMGLK